MEPDEKVNILLVDDLPENLLALQGMLEGLGENLVLASSGREALQHVLQTDFALIVLDVGMPVMDGFEVAKLVREREKSRHIPIIFLTATSPESSHIYLGYEAGAVDYIIKPVAREILLSKLRVFVELYRSRLKLADQIVQRERQRWEAEQLRENLEQEKRYSQQMEKLADGLGKANKVKDEFLSVMSHELRTPLTVVMGYTGMIMDGMLGEINENQKEALQKIINRSNDQLAMINSVLQATALEGGAVKVDSHEVNLRNFLDELRSSYEALSVNQLGLAWDYPSDLPVVKTDSAKLKQILQNLMNNAIKFTERGTVTISAGIKEGLSPQASRRFVEFKVVDTGIGIPKEHLPFIFEKFRQVDSSETRSFGGVGMGLYIVKEFTEVLGGTVEVESEPGKGSTFTVTIPSERVEQSLGG